MWFLLLLASSASAACVETSTVARAFSQIDEGVARDGCPGGAPVSGVADFATSCHAGGLSVCGGWRLARTVADGFTRELERSPRLAGLNESFMHVDDGSWRDAESREPLGVGLPDDGLARKWLCVRSDEPAYAPATSIPPRRSLGTGATYHVYTLDRGTRT